MNHYKEEKQDKSRKRTIPLLSENALLLRTYGKSQIITLLSPFPRDIISKRVEISTPRSIHNGYRALRPRGGVQNEKI